MFKFVNKKTLVKKNYNPIIYEKTLEGEEMHDVFSRLMKERVIFISGEIVQENSDAIIAQLLWLDYQNPQKEITLYINSPGGFIVSFFALYDVIQYIQAPVHTIVLGEAASCAAVLLACGTKGHRYALPNSQIMIHQPWVGSLGGTTTDVSIQVTQLQKDKAHLLEILAKHTGQYFDKVVEDCERDKYITAEEALKYGIIDEIFIPKKPIPILKKAAPSKKAKVIKKSKT